MAVRPVAAPPRPSRPGVRPAGRPRRHGVLAAGGRALRRVPGPLALLLAVTAVLSVAWAFAIAPLQGPDEPQHVNYASYLAETGDTPTVGQGSHPDSTELVTGLILANLSQLPTEPSARPAFSEADERRWREAARQLTEADRADGSGPNALGKNPPLYYAFEAVAYHAGSAVTDDLFNRLLLMRLANGLLLLATVALAWLVAAELFAATWLRLTVAGSVALLPELTALSGTVNADNLLVLAWTAFTLVALRTVRLGPSTGRVLGLCALAAASLLTHGRGTAILIPLAVTAAIALWRFAGRRRAALARFAAGGALLAGAFGAYRLLFPAEQGAYGGEVGFPGVGYSLWGLVSTTWQFYLPALPLMEARPGPAYGYRQVFIETFFGQFANLEVGYPAFVYTLIQLAAAAGLAALVAGLLAHRGAVWARRHQLAVLAAVAGGMLALLHLASYRSLVGTFDPLITGRYLLAIVVVFGAAVGFVAWALPRRVGPLVAAGVLGGLLALNLAGLGLTAARFYG